METRDLFISHAREDGDTARVLAHELEREGFTTWYYERDSVGGDSHLEQTGSAIEAASAFLVLVSARSLASKEVRAELEKAHNSAKPVRPVLLGVTWEQARRQKVWDMILGTRTAVALDVGHVAASIPRLTAGLRAGQRLPRFTAPPLSRGPFRWRSAPTTDPGVPSVLGTAESIAGAALFLYLAFHWKTLGHLALAILSSLFILLRTQESVELGLELYAGSDRAIKRLGESSAPGAAAAVVAYLVFATFGPILIRVIATAGTALRHPLHTLAAIPQNWTRLVACTDILTPPEILPGAETDARGRGPRFSHFRGLTYNPETGRNESGAISIAYFWAVAVFWRFLAKSAALYWIPVLWAAVPAGWTTAKAPTWETGRALVLAIREGAAFRLSLHLSTVTFLAGLLKITVRSWPGLQNSWRAGAPALLDNLIAIDAVPTWQIVALFNATLTWTLFLWADHVATRGRKEGDCLQVVKASSWLFPVRRALTLYTCIVEMLLLTNHLPDLGAVTQWLTPSVPRSTPPSARGPII